MARRIDGHCLVRRRVILAESPSGQERSHGAELGSWDRRHRRRPAVRLHSSPLLVVGGLRFVRIGAVLLLFVFRVWCFLLIRILVGLIWLIRLRWLSGFRRLRASQEFGIP